CLYSLSVDPNPSTSASRRCEEPGRELTPASPIQCQITSRKRRSSCLAGITRLPVPVTREGGQAMKRTGPLEPAEQVPTCGPRPRRPCGYEPTRPIDTEPSSRYGEGPPHGRGDPSIPAQLPGG